MKVGIVGAGIAGLSAAVAFARRGAEVVIYERPGTLPAGAGISLFGNGLRALDAIGLADSVRALGTPQVVFTGMRTPDGIWLVRTRRRPALTSLWSVAAISTTFWPERLRL